MSKPALKLQASDPQDVIFKSNIDWLESIVVRAQKGHHLRIANRPIDRTLGFYDTHEQQILLYHMKDGWQPVPGKILAFFERSNDQLLLEIGLGTLSLEKHSLQELSVVWDFDKSDEEDLIHLNDEPPEMTAEEIEWATYEHRARIAIKMGFEPADVSPGIAKVMEKILKPRTPRMSHSRPHDPRKK